MEIVLGVSILGLQLVIIGWLLYHTSQCASFHEKVARIDAEVKAVKDEIGDHDSGLRGSVDKLRGEVTPVVLDYQRRQER